VAPPNALLFREIILIKVKKTSVWLSRWCFLIFM
jgi:hypothetical protein